MLVVYIYIYCPKCCKENWGPETISVLPKFAQPEAEVGLATLPRPRSMKLGWEIFANQVDEWKQTNPSRLIRLFCNHFQGQSSKILNCLLLGQRGCLPRTQVEATKRIFSHSKSWNSSPRCGSALAPQLPEFAWLPLLSSALLSSLVLFPPAAPAAASPAGIPLLRSGRLPSAGLRMTARRLLTCHYSHCLFLVGREPRLSGEHGYRSTLHAGYPGRGACWCCWENPQARRQRITCLSPFPLPASFFVFNLM